MSGSERGTGFGGGPGPGPGPGSGRPVDEHPGDLLTAYLDDEVTPREAAEVEAHLVRCATCSAELDELTDARRLLRALPVVPAPVDFTRRIVERRRRANRRGAGLALVAAAVAAVLGIAAADPGADRPDGRAPMSLTSDSSRFSPFGSAPGGTPESGGTPGPDGPGSLDGSATTGGTRPSTSTTVDAATGPEEDSDPVTVGDRLEDAAASLLRLIGGG